MTVKPQSSTTMVAAPGRRRSRSARWPRPRHRRLAVPALHRREDQRMAALASSAETRSPLFTGTGSPVSKSVVTAVGQHQLLEGARLAQHSRSPLAGRCWAPPRALPLAMLSAVLSILPRRLPGHVATGRRAARGRSWVFGEDRAVQRPHRGADHEVGVMSVSASARVPHLHRAVRRRRRRGRRRSGGGRLSAILKRTCSLSTSAGGQPMTTVEGDSSTARGGCGRLLAPRRLYVWWRPDPTESPARRPRWNGGSRLSTYRAEPHVDRLWRQEVRTTMSVR